MKTSRLKTFLVYMHNTTDHRDDEVYKVKARDLRHAREVASAKMDWPGRFSTGWAMSYFPKKKSDRDFLKDYRWWASDKTD